jgi:hypothetical protein
VVTIGSPTVIRVPVAEEEKVAEVAAAPAEGVIPPETEKTE